MLASRDMRKRRTAAEVRDLRKRVLQLDDVGKYSLEEIGQAVGGLSRAYICQILQSEGRQGKHIGRPQGRVRADRAFPINAKKTIREIHRISKLSYQELGHLLGIKETDLVRLWATTDTRPNEKYRMQLHFLLLALKNAAT